MGFEVVEMDRPANSPALMAELYGINLNNVIVPHDFHVSCMLADSTPVDSSHDLTVLLISWLPTLFTQRWRPDNAVLYTQTPNGVL